MKKALKNTRNASTSKKTAMVISDESDDEKSGDSDDASTQSESEAKDTSADKYRVDLILLNTPSTEEEEIAEFVGCDIKHFECYPTSERKKINVVGFSVANARTARHAIRRVKGKTTHSDLRYHQGVKFERLRSVSVSGWKVPHVTNWAGLTEDMKTAFTRKYPEMVVIDSFVFPGKPFGNIILRDVEMAESVKSFKYHFVGVEFFFNRKEEIIIKGVAEIVIDGLLLQDMDSVKIFLGEEVGPLVRFEWIKKGAKLITICGFNNYEMSEKVVEGGVILTVPRPETRGGIYQPKVYWAKQYIAEPPSSKKEVDSPSKARDNNRAVELSSTRMQALDRQRADDFRSVREDLERGLKEQADRTIDLLNHQGRETTRAFSNTMLVMNQRNNEIAIRMQV